jgi:glutamyl-Q tRNA(Asp) synthetase
MEDIDPPREVAGAASAILHALERFGLHWDGDVLYQSTRTEAYRSAAEGLLRKGLAYRCSCTRALRLNDTLDSAERSESTSAQQQSAS